MGSQKEIQTEARFDQTGDKLTKLAREIFETSERVAALRVDMEAEGQKGKEQLRFLVEERQEEINSFGDLMKKQSKKQKEELLKVENQLNIVIQS